MLRLVFSEVFTPLVPAPSTRRGLLFSNNRREEHREDSIILSQDVVVLLDERLRRIRNVGIRGVGSDLHIGSPGFFDLNPAEELLDIQRSDEVPLLR